MKNKKIIGVVVICLVVAGLSFRGGMMYANSKSPSDQLSNRTQGGFNQNGIGQLGQKNQGMRGGANGGLISGEILTKDDKSMTIKLRDGGSKIVLFSPVTKVEKTVDGTSSDVVIGKQVTIVGITNSDGSVSATSIQLRPVLVNNTPIVPVQ